MNVTIINPQGKEYQIDVENSTPLNQMIKEYGVTSDTPAVAALCNGCYIRLNTIIDQGCTIALKDVRDAYGNMSLQYSLTLLYRCAIAQVIGNHDVQICNSLSKGLFTRIIGVNPTDEICHRIEEQMRLLVEKDIAVKEEYMERESLLQVCRKDLPEVYELVNSATDVSGAYIIELEGVEDYCPIHKNQRKQRLFRVGLTIPDFQCISQSFLLIRYLHCMQNIRFFIRFLFQNHSLSGTGILRSSTV